MTDTTPVSIRPCRAEDAETLLELIRGLAVYEKLEDTLKARAEDLVRHLFGPRPCAEALLASVGDTAVGFALFFTTFSTFRGQPGLYLEDVFVQPEHRGRGIGKALVRQVAQVAVERGCGRLEWAVLDWNQPAIAFYRSLGARPLDDWTVYRIDNGDLTNLAGS
jgi:GNAT superfamily N-acetyltransferase